MARVDCFGGVCRTRTGEVNHSFCPACRALFREAIEEAEHAAEPFCACGRRISQCDGSRRGCGKGAA